MGCAHVGSSARDFGFEISGLHIWDWAMGIGDLGRRILEFRISGFELRILHLGFQNWDFGISIQVWDAGFGILVFGYGIFSFVTPGT